MGLDSGASVTVLGRVWLGSVLVLS